MYESFYGFKENPFNLTPDPKYLFLSQSHREALGHLIYGVEQKKGFILITGGVGTGKTTLCRTFLNEFPGPVQTALIFNPLVSEEELLQSINQELGISYKGLNRKEMLDALNDYLIQQYSLGKTTALIIDESQNLDLPMLEKIRTLSNLETSEEKLIQIALVGQPELEDLLRIPGCRQINERIAVRCRIRPLAAVDIAPYIYHRLSLAGGRGDIRFTKSALKMIHQTTQGVPRRINVLCDRALLIGYTRESWCIDKKIICQARDETFNQFDRPRTAIASRKVLVNSSPAVSWGVLAMLLLMLTGILTGRIVVEWKPGVSIHGEATAGPKGFGAASQSRNLLPEPVQESKPEVLLEASLAAQPSSVETIVENGPVDEGAAPAGPSVEQTFEGAGTGQIPSPSVVSGDLSAPSLISTETSSSVSLQNKESIESTEIKTVKYASDPVEWSGVLDVDRAALALAKVWPFPPEEKSGKVTGDRAVPEAIHSFARGHGVLAMSFSMSYKQTRRFQLPYVLEVTQIGSAKIGYLVIESMDDNEYTFVTPDGRREQAPLGNLGKIWSGNTIIFSPALLNKRALTIGATGENVRLLQAKLQKLGYPIEEADGRFGPTTREALRQFQKDFHLQPDGIHGPRSMAVLYQLDGATRILPKT